MVVETYLLGDLAQYMPRLMGSRTRKTLHSAGAEGGQPAGQGGRLRKTMQGAPAKIRRPSHSPALLAAVQ